MENLRGIKVILFISLFFIIRFFDFKYFSESNFDNYLTSNVFHDIAFVLGLYMTITKEFKIASLGY
jgi:sensor histidine kinase YesM